MKPVDPCGLKRALLINDLSCFGKCSLSVSLPILSAYGVEAVPLPTAVLSTHTSGFTGYASVDMTEALRRFPAHWAQLGLRFDCIAVGYCTSAEQLRLAAALIRSLADEHTLVLHGAGDVFTSALCGELLSGKGPREALERAAGFCHRCIQETAKRQPGHWYGLAFEPALKGIWYE